MRPFCRTSTRSTTSFGCAGRRARVKYGEIRLADEEQFSVYNFEKADVDKLWEHLAAYEAECQELGAEYAKLKAEKKEAG